MSDWDALLEQLAEVPRENGTPGLHQTARFLYDTFDASGFPVDLVPFTAHPYALRLTGVIALVGGLLYLRWVRAGRHAAALGVAVVLPVLILAQLELYWPVFGWIGAEQQHHVAVRLPAREASQRLVFTAHYDTKTDVLDHLERAPVDLLALPAIAVMLIGALAALWAPRVPARAPLLLRLSAFAGWTAAIFGAATFVTMSAGAFAPSRSPGALDNGASCAALVRLVELLAAGPPLERTDVEVVLLSAEEVGVQGSRQFAAERFASPPDLPTAVVNLEGVGGTDHLAVLGGERTFVRRFAPDPALVALMDRLHRERYGGPLEITDVAGATDARSFLARGVAAATLISREPGQLFWRGLHSSHDDRSRVDIEALEETVAYLVSLVRSADSDGW